MAKRPFRSYARKSLPRRWQAGEVGIETWFERDRAFVGIRDLETDEFLVEWWDDDVRELFEDGFFVMDAPLGQPRLLGKRFRESVVKHAVQMGVKAYSGAIK